MIAASNGTEVSIVDFVEDSVTNLDPLLYRYILFWNKVQVIIGILKVMEYIFNRARSWNGLKNDKKTAKHSMSFWPIESKHASEAGVGLNKWEFQKPRYWACNIKYHSILWFFLGEESLRKKP